MVALRLLCFLLFPCLASCAVLAIRDVTVIDGSGSAPVPHSTIVIRGEKIVSVSPARSSKVPAGARIVDGRGKFAIPGLWDMHVHLWYAQNQLPLYVANGVTGVRDMGSDFARVAAWRRDIESGKAVGPHIFTSGPAVDGKPSDDPKLPVLVATTPEEARKVYDNLQDMGVDFVKVLSRLDPDTYTALAERCRQWRTDLAGHVPTKVTARAAIDARQASIEHLFGEMRQTDEEAMELFRASALMETWQVPTLTLWQRMGYIDTARRVQDPRLRQVPAAIRSTWPKAAEELAHSTATEAFAVACKRVRQLKESGAQILAGSDSGDPWTIPGVTLWDELDLLVRAGLTPMEALRSATALPAKFFGWEESVGQLKAGYVADIVLLTASPLADIRNVSHIAGVAAKGRYLGPQALAALRGPARK